VPAVAAGSAGSAGAFGSDSAAAGNSDSLDFVAAGNCPGFAGFDLTRILCNYLIFSLSCLENALPGLHPGLSSHCFHTGLLNPYRQKPSYSGKPLSGPDTILLFQFL